MFNLHDNVVYPGYGVARINRIFDKNVGGKNITFYELFFLNKDATVLVPTNNADAVGMRLLCSREAIDTTLNTLKEPVKRIDYCEFAASSWNKRNKGYQLKLRTGSLKELLEIYRDLRFIETQKSLSFGEKGLLSHAESLLVEEIAISCKLKQEEAIGKLRDSCASALHAQAIEKAIISG